MIKVLTSLIILAMAGLFLFALDRGLELEERRQCEIAIDNCDRYSDSGACESRYFKVCQNDEVQ